MRLFGNITRNRFVLVFIIISCGFVAYKYYNFKKYVNIYNEQSGLLAERIESYSILKRENIPSNKKDFDKMLEWLKDIDGVKNIINYGINFKYDNFDKSLSIYSFGIDKSDDNLERPLYSTSTDRNPIFGANDIIDKWNFWDIFNTKGRDVLLFKIFIYEDFLCRNYVKKGLLSDYKFSPYSRSYVFFQGNQKVSGQLEKELKEKIAPYKFLINPTIPKLNDTIKVSFIRFKNGKFYSVCSDEDDSGVFNSELKETLIRNEVDYAIIPIVKN